MYRYDASRMKIMKVVDEGQTIDTDQLDKDGKPYARCGDMNCEALHFVPLELWNSRPLEDALQARIAELEATVSDSMGDQ